MILATGANWMKRSRTDYTLEFKQEAARLVRAGQRQADVAASLGVSGQTLGNWVKAQAAGNTRSLKV
jgi:transposase-like protein